MEVGLICARCPNSEEGGKDDDHFGSEACHSYFAISVL